MPKKSGYKTGGKHDGKGVAAYSQGDGQTFDVTTGGAGMGNHYGAPNAKGASGPGGKGSTGTKSTSTPKG